MDKRARLNDLHHLTRLDLIEESRWQHGQDHVKHCIEENAFISEMCNWSKTRQGFDYWNWIDELNYDPRNN